MRTACEACRASKRRCTIGIQMGGINRISLETWQEQRKYWEPAGAVDSDNVEDAEEGGNDLNDADAEILLQQVVEWREDISATTDLLLDEAVERGLAMEKMEEELKDLKTLLQRLADK